MAEVAWHDIGAPLGSPNLRLLRRGRLRALAMAVRPDVVIERYHNFGGEGLLAADAVGARTVLEVNAPVVDYPGSPKRTLDRLLVAEPMRRWREWQCRSADLIVTTDRAILPAETPAAKVLETDWGADTGRFHPGATGSVPFARQPGELIVVFAGAFRAWHGVGRLVDAMATLERRGSPWRAVLIGDGPERPALEARVAAERLTRVTFAGSLAYEAMPAALAAADAGAAPFEPEAHAPLRHGFYWSPLKVFEYMASGLPVVAPVLPRLRAILAEGEAGLLYDGAAPDALANALDALADGDRRRQLGAAARRRALPRPGRRDHRHARDAARRGHRADSMTMAASRHVLLVTDAFPPVSGGSGWSTYELARGLRARGDRITVLRPRPGTPAGRRVVADAFDGFDVIELGSASPPIPFVRNYLKNERLAPQVGRVVADLVREHGVDVVHGQHLLSIPGAIEGAHAAGVPAVATIRDYWPVCYWSDLIHDRASATLCPACSAGMMTRCVRAHAGPAWPAALPAIPYMRANLRWRAGRLAEADAVIAVSTMMARDLVARAPVLADRRVEVIPNPVDVTTLDAAARAARPPAVRDIAGPYAIYVGKLAFNKGVQHLIPAAVAARLSWPLVVVGDGPDRAALEAAARAAGLDVRFTGWLDRAATLAHVAHAALLVFPSHGPESLSRVLLEASGLGMAIAAMDTGGTRDVIVPDETGLLSTSPAGLAADVARLVADPALRARLGAAAQTRVRATFATGAVVARVGALYDALIEARRRG